MFLKIISAAVAIAASTQAFAACPIVPGRAADWCLPRYRYSYPARPAPPSSYPPAPSEPSSDASGYSPSYPSVPGPGYSSAYAVTPQSQIYACVYDAAGDYCPISGPPGYSSGTPCSCNGASGYTQ